MTERRILAGAALLLGSAIPGFFLIFSLWEKSGLSQTDASDALKVQAFAGQHPALYAALPLLGVMMHLAALVLVIGMHRRLVTSAPLWVTAGSVLGLSWVAVDLVQNLMHYEIFLGTTPTALVAAANTAADAIWHAGHFGGGVWVLTLALAGRSIFGRVYRGYALIAGTAFLLHPFVFPLAPWWFGIEFLVVPTWAWWTAVAITRSPAFRDGSARIVS